MSIIHENLKLENILLDHEGYVKIINEVKPDQTFTGTLGYLAPEMVKEEVYDFAVDWWAIGILIYEMLIGITPFFNKNKQRHMQKICGVKVIFPSKTKYAIDYSDEFVDIVQKLLIKDRTKRLGYAGG